MRRFTLAVVAAMTLMRGTQAQCPSGWTLYSDSGARPANQEGHDSCLLIVQQVQKFTSAVCPTVAGFNTHLLTFASTEGEVGNSVNGLYTAARSLAKGERGLRGAATRLWVL